jgi:hypothetical protein
MSAVVAMWNRLFGFEPAGLRSARRVSPDVRNDYLTRCTEHSLDLVLRVGAERRATERSETREPNAV